jgi:hypothetical protein
MLGKPFLWATQRNQLEKVRSQLVRELKPHENGMGWGVSVS